MAIEFYIINDVDCPDSRHVVVAEDGIGRYNLIGGLVDYQFINFENATKLKDFGISIKKVSNGWICTKDRISIAKYKDGQPRQWQGELEFIVT